MADSFVKQVGTDFVPDKEENVYESIFSQYERVIVQSLITSFGLDFLVKDQYGGDVDTIHNVRKIGEDGQMTYKNKQNRENYENRGTYNGNAYLSDKKYREAYNKNKNLFREQGILTEDEYTRQNKYFIKSMPDEKRASLDHIIPRSEIHNDRGRVLSGLAPKELANSEDNFAWTNLKLNKSKNDDRTTDYVAKHPELSEETTKNMLEKDKAARKAYEAKLARAYYTSPAFFKDTTKAAAKVGVAMGLRQSLGLVFSEIWFAVKDEIKAGKEDGKALFNSIGRGVKQGLCNAKEKYKDLWHKFIEGTVAGVLASLTTTLCNIFFSTAKNLIRIIRQSWASLVEATKILLFNPDCLPFGERFRAAAKIIATGASVVLGSMVGDMIAKTGVGAIPVVGDIVQTFCATLVTGIMSCSLLYLLDRNQIVNKVVRALNSIPTVDDIVVYYREQARLLEEYCAKLMDIDLERFKKETKSYMDAVSLLESAANQQEFNCVLKVTYSKLGLKSPLGEYNDINSFMADPNSRLKFC